MRSVLSGPLAVLLLICVGCADSGRDQPVDEVDPNLPAIDSLWDYNAPEATEVRFRELMERAEDVGSAEYLVELLTQIGRAQGLQQQFEAADRTLDDAASRLTDDMDTAHVRLLLERGRVRNSAGSPEESLSFFSDALDLAEARGLEFYAVDAAHMLGIVSPGEASIDWNRRAIEMAESATDPRARSWLGSLYNNLGWTLHDLGRYEAALAQFERDFALRTELNRPAEAGIARWSIANTLRHLGRVDEALTIQRQLLKQPDRQDNDAEGYTREEIGENLLLLGRPEEAAMEFARAWELLRNDPWLSRDEPDRLERLRRLGGLE